MGVLKARVGGVWVPVSQGYSAAQVGYVAHANAPAADQTGISTVTDVTGMGVTFTAVAGHTYKTSVFLGSAMATGTPPGTITISITDAAGTVIKRANITGTALTYGVTHSFYAIESGLAGSVTRKVRAQISAGTMTVAGASSFGGIIVVEDITMVQPADTSVTTAWTAPTLVNSWVNYDAANWQIAQYRKVGDVVQLRGMIKSGVASHTLQAFTLPVGFRPPQEMFTPIIGSDAFGSCRIKVNGDVCIAPPTVVTGYASISGVTFSSVP